jgi:hypothetical protein
LGEIFLIMSCFAFGAINNFDYSPTTSVQGHLFGKGFLIFSQETDGQKIIPKYFKDYFGSVGFSDINSQPWVALFDYNMQTIYDEHGVSEEDKEQSWFLLGIGLFKHFSLGLWLLKDNSVSIKTVYGFRVENNIIVSAKTGVSEVNSNAQGEVTTTNFTTEEMIEAQKLLLEVNSKHPLHIRNTIYELYGANNVIEVENRVVRSYRAIASARILFYLPAKISMYVLALECLFSEGSEEGITHKISERVAYYLGETNAERREIYDVVNSSYRIRSKYVHGSNPNTTKNSLEHQHSERQKLSEKIDDVLRKIFIKILKKDSDLFIRPVEKSKSVSEKETFSYFLKSLVLPE